MVHDEADVLEGEQPRVFWRARSIENYVRAVLDRLITTFGWVLLLLVWFTLPFTNEQRTENRFNFFAYLHLRAVAYQFRWCSPFTDVVFQRVDELPVCFDTVTICDFRL